MTLHPKSTVVNRPASPYLLLASMEGTRQFKAPILCPIGGKLYFKATHFILRGNICFWLCRLNAGHFSLLSFVSPSHLSRVCSSLGPVSPTMGEDRRKVCRFLADSGPEGRCYFSATPALSCMKSLRAVSHLVTFCLFFPFCLRK